MREASEMPEFNFRCNGGGCVIVERIAGAVVIRDSKNPYQPGLVFSRKEYADFRRRVRKGRGAWLREFAVQSVQFILQSAQLAVRFALTRIGSA
ncbi:DUF397 domain-containing protein [Actinomadura rayongensis]|uniref:DUF397 domain-containing protein n=1 Tax=Actinomadura rayongensis TaxID=1429076 RepID=A0A6I4WBE9_9ACTN|nr:DUF397 domain-containing protein [Actinomadura rayongensis]MXQ65575.1 DUF397 domain-containing protein [Actinomadura rayongensis]